TDIYPGIYVWNGSEWVVHYKKRQSVLHTQTAMLRTQANFAGDYQDVPGLGIGDAKTFTAKYSGLYRIEVKTNFAGGRTGSNSSIFVSQAKGQFRFLFGGTPYTFETTAFSAYSNYISSGKYYEGIWKESYETNYVTLTAGTTYPFSLSFDAYDAPGFIGYGSTYTPRAAVNLVNEDFDPSGSYTVVQTFAPDAQCAPAGWAVADTSNRCSACLNRTLYINAGNNTSCNQNATARMGFTPTVNRVDISFDYKFDYRSSGNSFRVYVWDEVLGIRVENKDLIFENTTDKNTSYSGSIPVVAGHAHTLRFEYINTTNGYHVSVDHVVINEPSGAITGPTTDEGRGYVGNEVDCQLEFTYIGE
ncbi:MAG TPA: hypothetical protein VFM72_06380, partial [Aequorivita sp.]|nr:hypothetical protein [Aequorivita sp.]